VKRKPAVAALVAGTVFVFMIGGTAAGWYVMDRNARRTHSEREANRHLEEISALYGRARGAGRDLGLWSDALAAARRAHDVATAGDAPLEIREHIAVLLREIEQSGKNARLIVDVCAVQPAMGDDLMVNSFQDLPAADEAYTRAFQAHGINLLALSPPEAAAKLQDLGDEAYRKDLAGALDHWAYLRAMTRRTPNQLFLLTQLLDPDPLRNRLRDALMKNDRVALKVLTAEIDPALHPVQTINLLGVYLLLSVEDLPHAISFWQLAQVQHPDDFQINHNLAFVLIRAGRPEDAISYARAALASRRQSASAWQVLADALRLRGEDAEAALAHRRAAGLSPQAARNWYWAGDLFERLGQRDEAVAAYRAALKNVPWHDPRNRDFVWVWQKYDLLDEAVAEYQKAIDRERTKVESRWGLCTLLNAVGRYPEFIAASEALIDLDPNRADHSYYLGTALWKQNRPEAAMAAYRRCLAVDPKHPRGQQALDEVSRLSALDKKLPEVLAGMPAPIKDQLMLANMCVRYHHRNADAAALFAHAFAVDPKSAEDLNQGYRYKAACGAALASAGAGVGAEKLDAAARTRLRRKACGWLQADLAARAREMEKTFAGPIVTQLREWRDDADLASVRDGPELAKLPMEERAAWSRLWSEVARLIEVMRAHTVETEHRGRVGAREREQSYLRKLSAGMTCEVKLETKHLDARIRLEDGPGKVVAEADTRGRIIRTASIAYTVPADGDYRIVVSSAIERAAGMYQLTVREIRPPRPSSLRRGELGERRETHVVKE
jgi:tetratricopeptide (TPR) repeat protein